MLYYVYDVKSLAGNVSMMISQGKIISKCRPSDSANIPNAEIGIEPVTFF